MPERRHPVLIAQYFALAGFGLGAIAQVLVAVGVIPARHVLHGRFQTLTTEVQVIGIVFAIFLVISGLLMNYQAKLLHQGRRIVWLTALCWLITLQQGVHTILNAASDSTIARFVFGILTLYTFLACLVIMSRRTEAQQVEA